MKKIRISKIKGILFWLTRFSDSEKTVIRNNIKSEIIKSYDSTILIIGNNLRKILNFKRYSKNERLKNGLKFRKLFQFIINQKINVICAVVGLFDKLRQKNKHNIHNYVKYILNQI